MQRRSFLKSSVLGAVLSNIIPATGYASPKESTKKYRREFYELRVYTLKNKEQEKLIENYFENAAIPALNNSGIKNIGVFKELKPEAQTKIYVVIPFRSLDEFAQIAERLSNDDEHLKAGFDYLNAPASAPAYESVESSLHIAFTGMPKIVLPEKAPRIFELRRYQSANEMAGKKNIEMFNNVGELEIYKRVGLNPVFFGEAFIGSTHPNLTYMLTYNNMAAHDRAWKGFNKDQEWKQIKTMSEYADENLVPRITSTFLTPAACFRYNIPAMGNRYFFNLYFLLTFGLLKY